MTPALIAEAWGIQDLFHLSWWDALILSAAKILQCTYLLSEDLQHSQDFEGIRVINPFRIRPNEL
jgi:predicted nucleic acid-binding protein